MNYPIHLKLSGRRVLIVGGGTVAERRVADLLKAKADIIVISPAATEKITAWAKSGQLAYIKRPYQTGDLTKANKDKKNIFLLVIVATPDTTLNKAIADEAHTANILVNMAAPPLEESDFLIPSRGEKGGILLSIATGGGSPAYSKLLRQKLENFISPYAVFLPRLISLRAACREKISEARERERFWRETLNTDNCVVTHIENGEYEQAEALINNALSNFRAKS